MNHLGRRLTDDAFDWKVKKAPLPHSVRLEKAGVKFTAYTDPETGMTWYTFRDETAVDNTAEDVDVKPAEEWTPVTAARLATPKPGALVSVMPEELETPARTKPFPDRPENEPPARATLNKCSPDQERDDHGRWGSSGGISESAKATDDLHQREVRKRASRTFRRAWDRY